MEKLLRPALNEELGVEVYPGISVTEAIIVKDRDTGRSRGFGFVVMTDRKDASKAIDKLNGAELDGRNIVVNVATERSR